MLPEIPEHERVFWTFDDVQMDTENVYIKSYYHPLEDILPIHSHDFYEINVIVSGSGKHYIQQREILACKGDIFILPPNVKHGYSCNEKMSVYHILLSNRFTAEFAPFLEKLAGYRLLFNIEPMLRSSVETPFYLRAERMSMESVKQYIRLIEEDGNKASEAEIVCHVLSLIATMSRKMHQFKAFHDMDIPDRRVLSLIESIQFIENHHCEKIQFRTLAAMCAVSYSTYWRSFKKLTGFSPVEYQINCKIESAERLLRNSNESVLSIALSCGFYDSSHFIREFIRKKHISPADYRKAIL